MRNKEIQIDVITTNIGDLAMMGFGSIENCRYVYKVLAEYYQYVNFSIINTESDLENIRLRKPDLVFAGMKYVIFSEKEINKCIKEKVWISEYLDHNHINYTGSTHHAIELEFDKVKAKEKMIHTGIDTAAYFVSTPELYQSENDLPVKFPLFIKPLYESDSKGVDQDSLVNDYTSYKMKVDRIFFEFKQPAIVEKYLPGREFTVAVLGVDAVGDPITMPVEIVIDENSGSNNILLYETKKSNREKLIPILDKDIYQSVSTLAKMAFTALGARDFGRIDIKMDEQGRPFFLEANLLPGMNIDHSYFPQACYINNKISYRQLVQRMAEIALSRSLYLKNK